MSSSNAETKKDAKGILSNLNWVPIFEPMHSADGECPESKTSFECGLDAEE